MRLLELTVEGFRCFKLRSTFTFPDRAGLFLVQGDNQQEPQLGANGAGKSTLFDSVSWCLYGKTARRLSAGTVESWGLNPNHSRCYVRLTLETNGVEHQIIRGRHPIRLTLDDEPVEQQQIDDLFGLTYERFLHVILMGQFGALFPDLKPADRLTLVSEVLELEFWSNAAGLAASAVKELGRKLETGERELAGLTARAATLQEAYECACASSDAWADLQAERIEEAAGALLKARKRAKTTSAALEEGEAAFQKVRAGTLTAPTDHAGRLQKKQAALAKLKGEIASLARDHKNLSARLKGYETLDQGAKCPTCEQKISQEHIVGCRVEVSKALEKISEKLESFDNQKYDLVDEVNRLEGIIEKARADKRANEVRYHEAEYGVAELRRAAESAERDLSVCVKASQREKKAENPHEAELERVKRDLRSTKKKRGQTELVLGELRTRLDVVGFWPKGFKELRLWIIDQALDELTVYANSSLVELGLREWRLDFAVERETKSGSVSRGFDVLVKAPHSPEGVPWEAWSGGETQRLRIACAMGLANLIRSHMPSQPMLEVWDEPTDRLSGQGIEDLIECFNERAEDKQVWVIDHRAIGSGAFDGTVTIVKDEDGARIEA